MASKSLNGKLPEQASPIPRCFLYEIISGIHPLWASTESQLRAISFTLRLVNSGASSTARANSVVQTGVKSAGCENKIAQLKQGDRPYRIRNYLSPTQS